MREKSKKKIKLMPGSNFQIDEIDKIKELEIPVEFFGIVDAEGNPVNGVFVYTGK